MAVLAVWGDFYVSVYDVPAVIIIRLFHPSGSLQPEPAFAAKDATVTGDKMTNRPDRMMAFTTTAPDMLFHG